jgi:CheY-like chemotaxis protein
VNSSGKPMQAFDCRQPGRNQEQPMHTILIVDDNMDLCRPMAALLKHRGYDSHYATSGEDALKKIALHAPDLVILDVMMPEMDGLEVLRRLKAEVRTQQIPVVMFSAVADPEFRNHALGKGAIDYWVKAGIDFGDLHGRIAQLLIKTNPTNAN